MTKPKPNDKAPDDVSAFDHLTSKSHSIGLNHPEALLFSVGEIRRSLKLDWAKSRHDEHQMRRQSISSGKREVTRSLHCQ